MSTEIMNGTITDTSLGKFEDEYFKFVVYINSEDEKDYKYVSPVMDTYVNFPDRREGTKKGLDRIMFLLNTVGVDIWEELVSTDVRCKIENGKIVSIGHLTEDIWYPENISYGPKFN